MRGAEKAYSIIYKNILKAINPIKKKVITTECAVHQFINNQSLIILKNDGYTNAYNLISKYIDDINDGVVWADQDLKSSNHFYNPHTNRGMYGNSNAKKECMAYYAKALNEYFYGDKKEAMFYLGAACHLVQDLTVPQHANVKLLGDHRKYETWVIKTYRHHDEFKIKSKGIYLNSLCHYIDLNSKKALEVHDRYSNEKNDEIRFYNITSVVLVMAQKTTAGLMFKFFYDVQKITPIVEMRNRHSFKGFKVRSSYI